jgi:hypothetical protein
MAMPDYNFEEWLMSMDDKLGQLTRELPREVIGNLDYSPNSLAVLEGWLLSSYSSPEMLMESDKHFLDRVACYVGECFRKNLGGKWMVDNSDPESAYYGLPVVRTEGMPAHCPLPMVTAALDRRTGIEMKSILENQMA